MRKGEKEKNEYYIMSLELSEKNKYKKIDA